MSKKFYGASSKQESKEKRMKKLAENFKQKYDQKYAEAFQRETEKEDSIQQELEDIETALRSAKKKEYQIENLQIMPGPSGDVKLTAEKIKEEQGQPKVYRYKPILKESHKDQKINGKVGSLNPTSACEPDKKCDLTKWSYAELRDAINTSCDVELLEACTGEFHRRLTVYDVWRAKTKEIEMKKEENSLNEASATSKFNQTGGQRYFKGQFMTPSLKNPTSESWKSGWWYAHFDGQLIARQMELYSDELGILLVAGKDSLEMCKLSLIETGLAQKPEAEISEAEFEEVWFRYGGKPYAQPFLRKMGLH